MSLTRRLSLVGGVLVVAAGLVVAVAPSLAPTLPSVTATTAAVALAALVLGGHAAYVRARDAGGSHAALGAAATPTPPPEANVAVYLDDVTGVPGPLDEQARSAAYLDVRGLAVESVVRAERCSPAAVRRRLATGEWTDDDAAAAFFRGAPRSLRDRLHEWYTGETTFERRANRAVAAVARIEDDASADG